MTSVTPKTLALGLAALLVVLVLTSLLAGESEFVLPVVLFAAVIALAVAGVVLVGRSKQQHHGSARAANADEDDAVPGTQFLPDDRAPLGASTEAHDEQGAHDLPPDSAARSRAR
jgi:L-asparagine transporter-like permease